LDVGPGDEVIVPSLTYVATANAVRYVGAEPVFVDVDPDTWCIDPGALARSITPRTRAVIVVHLYGHPADMDAIQRVAQPAGIRVVEDAAEAFGATYRGRPVGSLGDCATFSFYGNKVITSGEGGALVMSDPELERRVRLLRGQGMDPNRRYFFPVIGYNYRLTNVACAILCGQLERTKAMLETRRAVARTYDEELRAVSGLGMQPVASWAFPTPWLFSMTVDAERFGASRDELMRYLAGRGVETRPFFVPLHTLPPYAAAATQRGAELPITDGLAASGLNLPTHSRLPLETVRYIADAVREMPR
jgi:perosamine synthetase